MKYKVVYESIIKNSRVLTLDKVPTFEEWCKDSIKVNDKIYAINHSTRPGLFAVDSNDKFLEEEIEFI